MKIKRGSTSVRRLIFIGDSSSTTGAGLASLVFNSAGLVAYYFAGDLSNEVAITLATATLGTFASGGFIAVDNTNMPGWYEIGIPDAALDAGNEVAIQLRGATNMVPVNIYIELDAFDYQTATQPVNVTQISGDSVAADNAESFFDGTGYAGTNNVIPTVTTLTNLPAITTNWLTAAGLATDAVTEIQSGLASQTSVDNLTAYVSSGEYTVAAGGGTSESTIDCNLLGFSGDWVDQVLTFLSGALTGQSRVISGFTSGSPDVITVSRGFAIVPSVGDIFFIKPSYERSVAEIQSGLATAANLVTVAEYLDTEIAAIQTAVVTTIPAQIAAEAVKTTAIQTVLSGITSLANWLRRLARKDAGTAGMITAEAEINTGGTSTRTAITDNLEAIYDAGGGGGGGDATLAKQEEIIADIAALTGIQLAAITVESGTIGNFPETITIGDSYTSNTGQIKIAITDSVGDPITTFGSLALADALIEFTAFRPNDSAMITGTCEFVDDITETYVLLTLTSAQTSLGVAEYTYEGRLKFFWEGAISSSETDADDEQKTYKTTPFKFISNP